MNRLEAIRFGALAIAFLLISLIFVYRYEISDSLFYGVNKTRYGIVMASNGAVLRHRPSTSSQRLGLLRKGTVLEVIGEQDRLQKLGRLGKGRWYNLRTRSGQRGWCFGKLFRFTPRDKALSAIHRDKADFEARVRRLIESEVTTKIQPLHRMSRVEDVILTTPINPESGSSFSLLASALMVGSFFGHSKYQVDVRIDLDLEFDPNHYTASRLRVLNIDILDNRKLDGLEPGQVVDLFMRLTPSGFFGELLRP